MRIAGVLAILVLSLATRAQSGGELFGPHEPPAPIPDLGLGQLPPVPGRDRTLDKPTNDALDRIVEKVSFKTAPLGNVLDQFAADHHVKIAVNWEALKDTKIDRSSPVTIELVGVPARRVLHLVLGQLRGESPVGYVVADNRVVVSIKEGLEASEYRVVVVYDLRPIFMDWELDSPQVAEAAEGLVETIRQVVAPDSWRENGGTYGSIRVVNGMLVIDQSLNNHDQIADLLPKLAANPGGVTRSYDVQDLVKGEVPRPAAIPGTPSRVDTLIAAIEANCGRDTWRGKGGKTSSVAFFEGKLYITTRADVHDQIERLLKLMRQ